MLQIPGLPSPGLHVSEEGVFLNTILDIDSRGVARPRLVSS